MGLVAIVGDVEYCFEDEGVPGGKERVRRRRNIVVLFSLF